MMDEVSAILWGLREAGIDLFVGEDGIVHGRPKRGKRMTLEARDLAQRLRVFNDKAAELIKAERVVVFPYSDAAAQVQTALDAMWTEADRTSGAVLLGGPVWIDKEADTVTVIFRGAGHA